MEPLGSSAGNAFPFTSISVALSTWLTSVNPSIL